MKWFLLLIALLCPWLVFGQGTQIQKARVRDLPSATLPSVKSSLFMVIDGTTLTDCTVGGGTNSVLCQSNGTIWIATAGTAGAPGGSPIQTQVNNNGVFGGTACEFVSNISTGPINIGCDWHAKGPNPYVDVQSLGVRALPAINVIPAVAGITATATGGQPTVTVSTSSCPGQTGSVCFVNGDGVVIKGAGAANTLGSTAAPTVTPFNARQGTGTGDGVAAPAGAGAFNYKFFACEVGGGCTAPSAAGSTATGNTLGAQSSTITSASRSNDTWTYTIGSAPPFSAGTVVVIDTPTAGTADADFEGTYIVATTTGTGFTVTSAPLDTRNGARTASIGGYTAHFWNYNKVTWTAVTGAPYRYFVCSDRQNPGTYALIGPALLPVNLRGTSFNDLTLEFDDFGQTMMAASASLPPWYITSANCTGAATNDNWVTTIASGAGTTNLTMSGNAPNSVSGAAILFDDTPNFLAAVATPGNIYVPVPAAGSYLTNSVMDLSANPGTIMFAASITANDAVLFGNNAKWYGDRLPGTDLNVPSFSFQTNPRINCNSWPCAQLSGGSSLNVVMSAIWFSAPNNGLAFMLDGGGGNLGYSVTDSAFTTGNTSTDFMGIAFVLRGNVGAGGTMSFRGKNLFISGTQAMAGTSLTPSFLCDTCGTVSFDEVMGSARAMNFFAATAGMAISMNRVDWQGGATPLLMIGNKNSGVSATTVQLGVKGSALLDTMAEPCLTNIANATGSLSVLSTITGCSPSSAIPQITGARVFTPGTTNQNRDADFLTSGTVRDGVFCVTNCSPPISAVHAFKSAINVAPTYPIFVDALPMAAPSCAVSAGGSLAVGAHTVTTAPVWQNLGESLQSPASSTCTTSSGNQTITVTWVTAAGSPRGYSVYLDGNLQGASNSCNNTIRTGTSAVLSGGDANCGSPVSISSGGPVVMMPGTQGIATPVLVVGNGLKTNNPAPTCSSTGLGTGGTCGGFIAGSDDISGAFSFTAGSTAAATGTLTLTFNNASPGNTFCMFNLSNQNTGWATGAGVFPILGSSVNTAVWNNNGTALTNTLLYTIFYQCNRH
ncbi:MAG TPA: hypothetical protein VF748_16140 [Candidatus Acidoferrum sp.]